MITLKIVEKEKNIERRRIAARADSFSEPKIKSSNNLLLHINSSLKKSRFKLLPIYPSNYIYHSLNYLIKITGKIEFSLKNESRKCVNRSQINIA